MSILRRFAHAAHSGLGMLLVIVGYGIVRLIDWIYYVADRLDVSDEGKHWD